MSGGGNSQSSGRGDGTQKPNARLASAWCPGGRAITKARCSLGEVPSRPKTASTAATTRPAARRAAAGVPLLTIVSASIITGRPNHALCDCAKAEPTRSQCSGVCTRSSCSSVTSALSGSKTRIAAPNPSRHSVRIAFSSPCNRFGLSGCWLRRPPGVWPRQTSEVKTPTGLGAEGPKKSLGDGARVAGGRVQQEPTMSKFIGARATRASRMPLWARLWELRPSVRPSSFHLFHPTATERADANRRPASSAIRIGTPTFRHAQGCA